MADWNQLFKDRKFQFEEPDPGFISFVDRYLKKGMKLGDIGCGRGRNSLYAAKKGVYVEAVDVADSALDHLRGLNVGGINVNKADMAKLPFEDESIDAIASVNVMNHGRFQELVRCFNEAFRVLKKDGYFYMHACPVDFVKELMTKETKELEPNTFINFYAPDGDQVHHFYSEEEVRKIFKDFNIIKYEVVKEKSLWMKKEICQCVLVAQKN